MSSPVNLTWTGDSFEPANRFWASKCDERFVVGQAYTLDEVHARSHASHAHYFSTLHNIWHSLPEAMAEKFPSDESLRKYALIRTGYRTETQHVCKTASEAERLAAAIRPYDTYQIVTINDLVVTVYNAISQDMRSMDKQTFQKSKEAVLDFCSDLVGIDPVETRRLAGIPVSPSADDPPSMADDDGTPLSEVVSPSEVPSQEPEGGSVPQHAPSGSVNSRSGLSSDDRRVLIGCFSQLLRIHDTDGISVKTKRDILEGAKDDWKRELPTRLHGHLQSIVLSIDGIIKGHDKMKAANEYAGFLSCRVEELMGGGNG